MSGRSRVPSWWNQDRVSSHFQVCSPTSPTCSVPCNKPWVPLLSALAPWGAPTAFESQRGARSGNLFADTPCVLRGCHSLATSFNCHSSCQVAFSTLTSSCHLPCLIKPNKGTDCCYWPRLLHPFLGPSLTFEKHLFVECFSNRPVCFLRDPVSSSAGTLLSAESSRTEAGAKCVWRGDAF